MSSDIEDELNDVEEQLQQLEQEIHILLNKQQELQQKREKLKQKLQLKASEELSKVDWEHNDFPWSTKLLELLKSVFKINSLRPYQLSTMNATLSGQDCILIMPTGGGKSLCYQLTALVSSGITLVISPLVSLMEDQLMALKNLQVDAALLNSSCSKEEVNSVHKAMTDKSSTLKLLYVTPEKLAKSKRFMSKLEKMYESNRLSRIAIDEVHCCSQWGNDFRPDYKFLGILKRQFPNVPILGLTATATSRVIVDVQKILNVEGCLVLKASFNRPNLIYEIKYKSSASKDVVDDMEVLIKKQFFKSSGIIYCFSVKDCEEIASHLTKRGIKAQPYHAQLDAKTRSKVHHKWVSNEIQVVVATVAFGMGIDKPDVRFVIHHSIPKSMENYYQESGRAGRDDSSASCILFYGFSDIFRQSTMVFTEQTGLENLYAMVAYCLDLKRCRRAIIAEHFGERWNNLDCNKMCDHCRSTNTGQEKDITKYCFSLYKIIDHAKAQDEKLTALKLIDAWCGKGPSKLRPSNVQSVTLSRDICERVVIYLLLEGYLKEDFHFTPYSTISYINKGVKANLLKDDKFKITLDFPSFKRNASTLSNEAEVSGGKKPKPEIIDLEKLPF
ncbi:ATP-dependent DNA helicase Q1-like isoform X1 [Centruroides vittatus]|uniref:ATP-dependent DNA helicase Q1-like isoform X1 n=1 Tax=Centruroides vittatus TaxID=120091 RepID=UPI00350EDA96